MAAGPSPNLRRSSAQQWCRRRMPTACTPRALRRARSGRQRNGTALALGTDEPSPSTLPFLRSVATAFVSRRTARRLARIIPNPLLRYAVVTIGSALVPVVVGRIGERWANRRVRRWETRRIEELDSHPDASP